MSPDMLAQPNRARNGATSLWLPQAAASVLSGPSVAKLSSPFVAAPGSCLNTGWHCHALAGLPTQGRVNCQVAAGGGSRILPDDSPTMRSACC